jgi:hypothetical protein
LDYQQAGDGAYPIRNEDPHFGMECWNHLAETRRANWLMMVASEMLAAARHAYHVP